MRVLGIDPGLGCTGYALVDQPHLSDKPRLLEAGALRAKDSLPLSERVHTIYRDPTNGYAKYIDVDSFIDHHIIVELTKNIDGFRISTYYTKDRLGKIKMGSQVTAILLLIVGWGPIPALAPLGYAALWVVMAAAVVSAVDYYRRFQRLLNARVTDVNIARERRAGDRRAANSDR